jgi:GAF domain-containing protein
MSAGSGSCRNRGLPILGPVHRETPLSYSICQNVVARGRPLVIEDAREMSLTASNLAVQDLGVVAYLGVPLEPSSATA